MASAEIHSEGGPAETCRNRENQEVPEVTEGPEEAERGSILPHLNCAGPLRGRSAVAFSSLLLETGCQGTKDMECLAAEAGKSYGVDF